MRGKTQMRKVITVCDKTAFELLSILETTQIQGQNQRQV
jgi:hypothetical protein